MKNKNKIWVFSISIIILLLVIGALIYCGLLNTSLPTPQLSPGGLTQAQLAEREALLAGQRKEIGQATPLTSAEQNNRAEVLKSQRETTLQN